MLTKKVVYIRSKRCAFREGGHPALKCHPDSRIEANTYGEAKEWEKWTLYEHSDGDKNCISLRSWTGRYLSVEADGSVCTSLTVGDREMWEVETTSGGFVSLKSHFGKFLCCDDLHDVGRDVRADRDNVLEWEEWMIVDDPHALTEPATKEKRIYIRSKRTSFGQDGHPALKCYPNSWIEANTYGEAKEWEKWTLYEHSHGDKSFISLKSWTGRYLSAKSDGSICTESEIGDQEIWEVEATSGGFISFKSHFGKFLCCDKLIDVGRFVRADRNNVNEWEEWMIVDDPHALTYPGSTARYAIGGTFVALGSIVTIGALAIPFVGFGVAGVAAGSAAAGVQSAMYGGATCGVFSVLQSVGATLAWVPIAGAGATATATGAAVCAGQKQE